MAELAALSHDHKAAIVDLNCKVEKACGYAIDKGCGDI